MKLKNSQTMLVVKQHSSQCSLSVPSETLRKAFCIINRGGSRNLEPHKTVLFVKIVNSFESMTFSKQVSILDVVGFLEPSLINEFRPINAQRYLIPPFVNIT